jgi:hypothetical protein
LVAAQLETADRQIQHVADYIEEHSMVVSRQVREGNLDIKIDPIIMGAYLSERFPEQDIGKEIPLIYNDENEIVRELN